MTLTAGQKEAYARAHTSTVVLCSLELRHASFGSTIRLAQGVDDVTFTLEANAPVDSSTSVSFTAVGFEVKEPAINTEPDTVVSVSLIGISSLVLPYLGAASKTSVPVEATLRFLTFDTVAKTVSEVYTPIHLQARNFSTTKTNVSVELGYTNTANKPFPSIVYTAESNPSLL